jgi:hypothetical protein
MGVTDPIVLVYYENRDVYILVRGRETFYDDNDILRDFEEPEDAVVWCEENLGVTPEIGGVL